MIGHTMVSVSGENGGDDLLFESTDGTKFHFYHGQDCCESVYIEDICGDLSDLVGSPMILAEEDSNYNDNAKNNDESCTWTFYRFGTAKGIVTVRWYGSSNGYYSESVTFMVTRPKTTSNS